MIDIIFRHIKSCRTDHILLTLIRNGYGVKGVISHREKGMVGIMIKIALCDDDVAVLNEIKGLLNRYRETYHQEMVLEEFQSSLELLSEMEKGLCVDILFLDILMPGEDGISVAREIRQYNDVVKIIFLTSTAEFAVESYTVGAYFYQMKPVREESLFRLLGSVILECEKLKHRSVILRCKSGITRIHLEKLVYCEVIGRTLMFHMEDGNVLESVGSMEELCSRLEPYENFLHPHRSFLINMEYIQNITYKAITMDNQAEIPVPHGKCTEIKNKYLDYAFSRKQVLVL